MNKAESIFKGKENQSLVCIKYNTSGKIDRVKQGVAYNAVEKQGIATYCSKEEWKKFKGIVKPKEVVAKEDTAEKSGDRIKGAKNIRAANKKKK